MSSCEKCWLDAHYINTDDLADAYHALLAERSGVNVCTPEEQAGANAGVCPKCGRRTTHQITGACMTPNCEGRA